MALPVINTPRYKTTIPSSGKEISFRPFLVKEEKALLIAQQSEDLSTIIATLEKIIESCTDGKVKSEGLAVFDLEWFFIQLRARSVGEDIELEVMCDKCPSESPKISLKIDLLSVQVEKNPDHSKNIILFDDVGVTMRYPSIEVLKQLEDADEDVEKIFDVIVECVEAVYNKDTVYPASESSKEEMQEFVNNLTKDQFDAVQKFFSTAPKIYKDVEYTCPTCKKVHKKRLEGFQSFFR